jgi:hypothetical protein
MLQEAQKYIGTRWKMTGLQPRAQAIQVFPFWEGCQRGTHFCPQGMNPGGIMLAFKIRGSGKSFQHVPVQ